MTTPTITPTTPRGLVVVTGGSGYIAGHCIAQLLDEGWRARTTVRNLRAAEEVRATVGKITANVSAIEFMAADLNSDVGWADAVTGADYVLHVALLFRARAAEHLAAWRIDAPAAELGLRMDLLRLVGRSRLNQDDLRRRIL